MSSLKCIVSLTVISDQEGRKEERGRENLQSFSHLKRREIPLFFSTQLFHHPVDIPLEREDAASGSDDPLPLGFSSDNERVAWPLGPAVAPLVCGTTLHHAYIVFLNGKSMVWSKNTSYVTSSSSTLPKIHQSASLDDAIRAVFLVHH